MCVLEEKERFDWPAYLREGIEFPTYSDNDSEVCDHPLPLSYSLPLILAPY